MMLEALVALAERKGLLNDQSLVKRRVDYQVRLADDGRVLGVISLGEEGRGLRLEAPVPPPNRTSAVTPGFLVDNTKYAFGVPKAEKNSGPDERAIKTARRCLSAFENEIRVAAEATRDEGLMTVCTFLQRLLDDHGAERQRLNDLAPEGGWNGNEVIAFIRDSDGSIYVHERPLVRAYWASIRGGETAGSTRRRCLVTGLISSPVRIHGVVGPLPKPAQTSGVRLVSFNQESFKSQGFQDHGANAPISQRAADGYVRALNWLLRIENKRRPSGLMIGPDAVLVFWTRDGNDTADVLLSLFAPDSASDEDLRASFEAAWKGLVPREVDATKFYALTLSGNTSRLVVRDWLETTAAEAKANVRRYFEDLALDGDDAPLSISRLLRSLEATPSAANEKHGLSSALATRLMNSALRGAPFPRELLHTALSRLRVPPSDREWRGTIRARVALIKATLLRLQPDQEVTVSLDETNQSVPYLLGRLFAAVEKLQADALGDVNASLRDRYFGSASATPAFVFPRLLDLSNHHASKAESEGKGWSERIKAEIMNRLPAEGAFPRTLRLEERGLFAVGYYHQREAFFAKRKSPEGEAAG